MRARLARWFNANRQNLELSLVALQTVILCVGVYQLVQTQQQIRGATVQATFQTTKDLQLKALDTDDLHPLLFGADDVSGGKRRVFLALLVNHYYTIYQQYRLGTLPESYWDDVQRDAALFFTGLISPGHWNAMRNNYARDFQRFVDSLYRRVDTGRAPQP